MKALVLTSLILAFGLTGATAQIPSKGPAPKVTGYDFDGKKFSFADELKGHYSVIVFGCLT